MPSRTAGGWPSGKVHERHARRRQQQAAEAGAGDRIQMILCVALLGVAVAQLVVLPVPGRPGTPPLGDPVALTPVATASEARPAASDIPRFIPERIELPGDASAAMVPVATVGRELVVPRTLAGSAGGMAVPTSAIRMGRP